MVPSYGIPSICTVLQSSPNVTTYQGGGSTTYIPGAGCVEIWLNSGMRLLELFTLLELRDRVSATAETYQKKLIQRFKTAKEEGKLRGASPRVVQMDLDKEQYFDAAKAIVNYFAEGDPTKNNKYLDWIVRQWIKGHLLWEDSFKMRNLIDDFEKYRKKLEKKDINHYESYHDLEEALEPLRGTEVAGIRVQNFLKKAEVQRYRNSNVANPMHPHNVSDYNSLYGDERDENDPEDMPSWFEDEVAQRAEENAEHDIDAEDFEAEARDEVEESEYTDEDGNLDEEEYEDAVSELTSEKWHEAKVRYVVEYVSDYATDEWREYVENNRDEYERALATSEHRAPELDVIYNNDRMAVLVPHSKDAACYIGKGTEWCTAAEESDNYWWEYTKDGPLYAVITDKLGKFQFHFESGQFMDEHDRYIEDSNALISLVKRYPKELGEAFGEHARDGNEWWLLPAEEIPAEAWEQMLDQTENRGIHSEDVTRDNVRVWQAHHDKAPEGWSDKVRTNILSGRTGELAINRKWFGETEGHEVDAAIKKGLKFGNINAVSMARHVVDNNIEISPEAWIGLITQGTDSLFYAPLEIIDRKLLNTLLEQKRMSPQRTSYLADFYRKFKQLLERAEGGPDEKYAAPAPAWSDGGLLRARKLAGLITMKDIIDSVLRNPDDLTKFKMDFGMKPWLAAARDAENKGTVEDFLNMASHLVRENDEEEWATGDLTNLIHQLITKEPGAAQSIFRHPKGIMPLDTQNAILNYISKHQDARSRGLAAQRLGTAAENGRFSPEAEKLLHAYRQEDNDADIAKLHQAMPAQQQIEMTP